jgi:hypothetical protein
MSSKALGLFFAFAISGCGGFSRGEPSPDAGDSDDGGDSNTGETLSFATSVEPILKARCASCHGAGGIASSSSFRFANNASADYTEVLDLIDTDTPASSELLRVASGQSSHGGGTVLPSSDDDYQIIIAWISAGAAP